MVRPSALAVLRLMTNSNVVGCKTGRSAGLAPLRFRFGPSRGEGVELRVGPFLDALTPL